MYQFLHNLIFGLDSAALHEAFLWIPIAAGAALGAMKNQMDQSEANKQRQAQAEIQKWSPWTGLQGQTVKNPSLIGNIFTGASVGAMANGMFPGQAAPAAGGTAAPTTTPVSMSQTPGMDALNNSASQPQLKFNMAQPSWMQMYAQQQKPSLYSPDN